MTGDPTPAGLLTAQSVPRQFEAIHHWSALLDAAEAQLAGHGDLARWTKALTALPDVVPDTVCLGDRVGVGGRIDPDDAGTLRAALTGLHPWRKGPFELFGVHIDTEWRSDWKWQRIAPAIGTLNGAEVLDVGCGNGYFGWRALGSGAARVLAVDPSVLFFLQHLAVSRYLAPLAPGHNVLLPVAFERLPGCTFDLVLSMGVIYHRPDPAEHVRRLFTHVRPGGRLLLESLVVTEGADIKPGRTGRYARMRNVSIVPRVERLVSWLEAAGFTSVTVVDITATTTGEQRRTPWMTFESLAEALDPQHPGRTVEGYPAPVRAALLATR
ncbi:MAG: tRNA 5-methoxyuridine(34)/uridine 5-oxyacetic acid(34) synthase CmoB [Pseudomonadales bacterium]